MTCLLPGIFLFSFGTAYELRLMNYGLETVSKVASRAVVDFWGFCSIISGVAHIVRPHLDYCTCATVSKQKFNIVFYLL